MLATSSLCRATRCQARRLISGAAVVVLLSALLTACSSGSESGSHTPSSDGTSPEIRIGYQLIPNGDLIVKDKGWLEEALPGTQITWIRFDSSADVNAAMVAGGIDIGLAGSIPVAAGLSMPTKIPYEVPWIHDVVGTHEGLVVRNSVGILDFAGLSGRKIATPFWSTAHYSLLTALEHQGLSRRDVEIRNLNPRSILAAWRRGDIDAAYVSNPTLAELTKDGTLLTTSAELADDGTAAADLAVVATAFSSQHPAAVRAWIQQQNRAVELIKTDTEAAAEAIGRQLNISPDKALARMKGLLYVDASEQASESYLGTSNAPGGLANHLRRASAFLKRQGSVEEVPDLTAFQESIASQYAAQAAGR